MMSCRRALTIEEVVDIFVDISGAHHSRNWLGHRFGRRALPGRLALSRAPGALGPVNVVSGAGRLRADLTDIDAGVGRSQAGCRQVHGELLPLHGEYVSAGRRAPSFSSRDQVLKPPVSPWVTAYARELKGHGHLGGSWNRQ